MATIKKKANRRDSTRRWKALTLRISKQKNKQRSALYGYRINFPLGLCLSLGATFNRKHQMLDLTASTIYRGECQQPPKFQTGSGTSSRWLALYRLGARGSMTINFYSAHHTIEFNPVFLLREQSAPRYKGEAFHAHDEWQAKLSCTLESCMLSVLILQ